MGSQVDKGWALKHYSAEMQELASVHIRITSNIQSHHHEHRSIRYNLSVSQHLSLLLPIPATDIWMKSIKTKDASKYINHILLSATTKMQSAILFCLLLAFCSACIVLFHFQATDDRKEIDGGMRRTDNIFDERTKFLRQEMEAIKAAMDGVQNTERIHDEDDDDALIEPKNGGDAKYASEAQIKFFQDEMFHANKLIMDFASASHKHHGHHRKHRKDS